MESKVEGLSSKHIAQLRKAKAKGKVKFYCLSVVWVEVISKICREIINRVNILLDGKKLSILK